ncbi:MAG TPA: DUF2905 domain-containing protein [Phycisphaerae bacterium]|nr:DUF2905 domain-containing protein [Phycisphaerae bacterium]HOJ74990.1 DUF2905 domain-containing protein [Phycisphaerae bacterium]HOM51551.1 DUF2905 domain-containing protein [Phycisphaerae bacterium]HON67807.1 DUF2905 domain-containing protein [Phycisphaerae bacterium]HOQ85463.1 DUF2905 domain-containing protein [Phycisphaerae bacterium]
MTQIGRIMMVAGLVLALAGGIVWILGRIGFRGLPGDIRYEGENVQVYFPIVTCILLSLILTGLLWLSAFLRDWWHR